MTEFSKKTCKPCEGGVPPLTKEQIATNLQDVSGWQLDNSGVTKIFREFKFKNYYHVMSFVNAIAWIAHHENHHPDLEIGYDRCLVCFSTHSIGGLSENDFICAAKINDLF